MALIDEAVRDGARLEKACELVGLSERTLQRWRSGPTEDQRRGPKSPSPRMLSKAERAKVLEIANAPENRGLTPHEIVPKLADQGTYVASESTFYRVLREERQVKRRDRTKKPVARPVPSHEATAPNQVWSWDITWLRALLRGSFFKLYMIEDIYSRKIVGWDVHVEENAELSSMLVERTCLAEGVLSSGIVLHADNGGAMKGSTMLATLQRLGVVPSFSRPSVSDDNPFIESLFRHLKYCPTYPSKPFASLEEARAWVASFVAWYNNQHLHGSIRHVTPAARHEGRDASILTHRQRVYERARASRPERWARSTRNWTPVGPVSINHSSRRREHREAVS